MTIAPRILILYAHPASHLSRINRRLAEAAGAVANVQVHDLYETYPDFYIDVPREQALLADADLVVFQHPLQWYSMPALLKQWLDVVLEPGWAHGDGGTALRNKGYWLAVTTGGAHESYQEGGYHGHAFADFLPPFQQTADLCGMRWLPPYVVHGAHRMDDAAMMEQIAIYRERLATYPHWPELTAEAGHSGIAKD